jgi:hypothetical protein
MRNAGEGGYYVLHSATISSKAVHLVDHTLAEVFRLYAAADLEASHWFEHILLEESWRAKVLSLVFNVPLLN